MTNVSVRNSKHWVMCKLCISTRDGIKSWDFQVKALYVKRSKGNNLQYDCRVTQDTVVTKHGTCNYWVMDLISSWGLSILCTKFIKLNTRMVGKKISESLSTKYASYPWIDPNSSWIQARSITAEPNLLILKRAYLQQLSVQILAYVMALQMPIQVCCSVFVLCTDVTLTLVDLHLLEQLSMGLSVLKGIPL
jgi:hypothetical protein